MIRVENIHKSFGELQVLKGIDLEVNKGEIVSIVGPSGAGKTTLLMIMGTLEKANSGKVFIGDNDLSKLSEKKLSDFRNKNIGFVFQFHQLLPEFTALENVMIPALIGNAKHGAAEKRAKELLQMMGLSERMEHKPAELSGGEKQRVAVARGSTAEEYLREKAPGLELVETADPDGLLERSKLLVEGWSFTPDPICPHCKRPIPAEATR